MLTGWDNFQVNPTLRGGCGLCSWKCSQEDRVPYPDSGSKNTLVITLSSCKSFWN